MLRALRMLITWSGRYATAHDVKVRSLFRDISRCKITLLQILPCHPSSDPPNETNQRLGSKWSTGLFVVTTFRSGESLSTGPDTASFCLHHRQASSGIVRIELEVPPSQAVRILPHFLTAWPSMSSSWQRSKCQFGHSACCHHIMAA